MMMIYMYNVHTDIQHNTTHMYVVLSQRCSSFSHSLAFDSNAEFNKICSVGYSQINGVLWRVQYNMMTTLFVQIAEARQISFRMYVCMYVW